MRTGFVASFFGFIFRTVSNEIRNEGKNPLFMYIKLLVQKETFLGAPCSLARRDPSLLVVL